MRQAGKHHAYPFRKASPNTSLKVMALRQSQRYFIERDNQDAKSEFGWDEIQTTSDNAWPHRVPPGRAFTVLAQGFIPQTRLEGETAYLRDPDLLSHYQVDLRPLLSVANVRELLRAALPLPTLSP